MSKPDETVKVVVRIRPLFGEEIRNGNQVVAVAYPERGQISVKNPKANDSEPPKDFFFDAVYNDQVEQKHIYDTCAAGVVDSVLNGYNGTIFAYGQTGAGKTHTMEGKPDPKQMRGIIPNSFQHIFEATASNTQNQQYLVRASYLEIYNEEIRDLLSKDPKTSLELKENIDSGVYVKDLTSFVVKNVAEIDHVMQAGKKNRSTGATLMNMTSSRSHSIFTIVVECGESDARGDHIRVGKLNLVDLAGSERQSKTGATGDRLKEANKINLSLTALGNVITALVDAKSSHIPYRDSKLTRLLQNSLGGNAKTVMCANCGPADYNFDETISTLRYANRAKNIKNKPKINEDPKDAMLREYQDQIKALRDQLDATQRGVMIREDGSEVTMTNAQREIVEKIVEREVFREVRVGVTDEEMAVIRKKAEEEKEVLMKQAQQDMKALMDQASTTAKERAELQAALDQEAVDRKELFNQKRKLAEQLKAMEEKLIKGGEVISKASKQEAALRQAETELRERQVQEAVLARELAEKEEANLQLEEHFSSLQEEVEVKTKKLKKLWGRYQAAEREAKDLQEEFGTERNDMLDTIRQLTRTMKLKETLISKFIPEDTSRMLEKRAAWIENEQGDGWIIPKMEVAGSLWKASIKRPISSAKLRRPETEFSRQRKQIDASPRYRYDNILLTELDMPEKTTQEFAGPGMKSRVDQILAMDINGDEGEDV
ncbi:kinesin-like protein, partial [Ochromonadaceae sp. CCMP2298]